jgi:hypothetical protein
MEPEVRREYERHLIAVTLRRGTLVVQDASMYGWADHENIWDGSPSHLRTCQLTGTTVEESEWNEFMGTFYEGDTRVHGIDVDGVNCACGKLRDRTVRWAASVSEIAEAVFEELYHSTKIDDTPAEG